MLICQPGQVALHSAGGRQASSLDGDGPLLAHAPSLGALTAVPVTSSSLHGPPTSSARWLGPRALHPPLPP